VPLGVYRVPIQTGTSEVTLKTFLIREETSDLVLLDVATGSEFGRATANYDWTGQPEPYAFATTPFVVSFYVRDGIVEDAVERPYAPAPAPPLDAKADHVSRVTLASGGDRMVLYEVGGHLFADRAFPQPAVGSLPSPLAALASVSGAGLVLPADANGGVSWKDALSSAVPPDAAHPLACAAPLVSVYRPQLGQQVVVPAGTYTATKVTEVIDSCLRRSPADVKVYESDRWLVAGTGPVKMTLTQSDGKVREYRLTQANVKAGSADTWPLDVGNAWTFDVFEEDGTSAGPAMTVRVEKVETVAYP
jgi:hypothetical protein